MRPARTPIIYALVLVLVLTSGAGGLSGSGLAPEPSGPSPTPGNVTQPIPNTAAYLAIKDGFINETTTDAVTLDVGGSLAFGTNDLDGEFQSEQFEAAYDQANSSEKETMKNNALNRSEQKLNALKQRQRDAISAYNNGEISTQTFLRRLVLISSEANQVDKFVIRITDGSGGEFQKELEPLRGPVRSLLQNTFQGDRNAPNRYFVRTTDHGVVLATINKDQYVREAFLSGARTVPSPDGIKNMSMAIAIAQERYPHVGNEDKKVEQRGDIFGLEYTHSHGNLTTFLDENSGKVFYEKQYKQISSELTADPNSTTNEFTMTVWTTHEGGPLIVKLTESEHGTSRNGTVAVGNETVGETGETGEAGILYTLQPAGETVINATVKGESVTMTIGSESTESEPTPP